MTIKLFGINISLYSDCKNRQCRNKRVPTATAEGAPRYVQRGHPARACLPSKTERKNFEILLKYNTDSSKTQELPSSKNHKIHSGGGGEMKDERTGHKSRPIIAPGRRQGGLLPQA